MSRVLLFGTFDKALHPRVAVLEEGLADSGFAVTECNVPLGLSTAQKVDLAGRATGAVRFLARIARTWWRLLMKTTSVSRPDVVLVGYMGHFDVLLARLRFPKATIVLDHLAPAAGVLEDRELGGRLLRWLATSLDRFAIGVASLVIVDTVEHLRGLSRRQRGKAIVVPVGAGSQWFGAEGPEAVGERITVVFFGLFTPLQGAVTIARAIAQLDEGAFSFTVIGSGQEFEAARAAAGNRADVDWIDWVDGDALPSLVAGHDVCLGVFGTTSKSRRVTPTKVYQGAAAGCLVVTSDTPPQRRALGDTAVFVPAGDASALAAALRGLDRDALPGLKRAARDHASAHFAPRVALAPLVDRLRGE